MKNVLKQFSFVFVAVALIEIGTGSVLAASLSVTDNGANDLNPAVGIVDFDYSSTKMIFSGRILDDPTTPSLTLTNFVFEVFTGSSATRIENTLTYTGATIPVSQGTRTTAELSGLAVDADNDGVIGHVQVVQGEIAVNSGAAESFVTASVIGNNVANGASVPFSDGPNVSAKKTSFSGDGNLTMNIKMAVDPGDRLELPNSFVGIVPEPGSLALITLGSFTLMRRR